MTVFERLKKIISEAIPEIDLNSVTGKSRLKSDLGIDSIETMMIAILIEEEFGFKFEDAVDFETVEDICRYIENRI